jgi:hypothetical protein
MARVLVTGASGFIGYGVTEALLARGDDVLATDVAISPRLQKLAEQNPALKFTAGEITEWPLLVRLLKDGKPNKIVHCAAVVGVPASVGSPIGTFRVNVEGTINLLEAMRFFGVRRMVNTRGDHGPSLSDTIDEDHRCLPTKPGGIPGSGGRTGCPRSRIAHGPNASTRAHAGYIGLDGDPAPRVICWMPPFMVTPASAGGASYAVTRYIDDVVQGVLAPTSPAQV